MSRHICEICENGITGSSIFVPIKGSKKEVCASCIGEGLIRLAQRESMLKKIVLMSAKEIIQVVLAIRKREEK